MLSPDRTYCVFIYLLCLLYICLFICYYLVNPGTVADACACISNNKLVMIIGVKVQNLLNSVDSFYYHNVLSDYHNVLTDHHNVLTDFHKVFSFYYCNKSTETCYCIVSIGTYHSTESTVTYYSNKSTGTHHTTESTVKFYTTEVTGTMVILGVGCSL